MHLADQFIFAKHHPSALGGLQKSSNLG